MIKNTRSERLPAPRPISNNVLDVLIQYTYNTMLSRKSKNTENVIKSRRAS